jgi:hypothetical protein
MHYDQFAFNTALIPKLEAFVALGGEAPILMQDSPHILGSYFLVHLALNPLQCIGHAILTDAPTVEMTSVTLARAKPPPRRKMTPQHILVSMSRQVIRDGEFFRLLFIGVKGQKS